MFIDKLFRLYFSPEGDGGNGGDGQGGDGQGGDGGQGGEGGQGGGSQTSWHDTLPAEIKDHPTIKNFKTPEALAKSYLEAQKLIGRDKVILPTDKSTPDEIKAFHAKLGVPDTADKYQLPAVQLPQGLTANPEQQTKFKAAAHQLGLTPKQVAGLYQFYQQERVAEFNSGIAGAKQKVDATIAELKTQWGAAFDANVALGEKVLNQYGDDDLKNFLRESKLNNDPRMIKFLATVGSKFSEHQLLGEKSGSFMYAPAEARKKMNEMQVDPKHPLNVADHPEHAAALEEYIALATMANSGG